MCSANNPRGSVIRRAVSSDISLGAITILPFDAGADRHYAAIRTALVRKGTSIGAHDMPIAAHARAIDAVCVTDNVAEFKRVPALKVENWLALQVSSSK
jgi:tRNA(fMet)-specific endonuclease VapC